MSNVELNFSSKPPIATAMLKALVLPRTGFNASRGLPNISATWNQVSIGAAALNQYRKTLGLENSEYLPVLYPHVIAGGMHMHMLSHKAFPLRLLGALHLKNRIRQYEPILASETVDLSATMGGWRLVEKGLEFDFDTTLKVNEKILWEETSTYFMAGKFGGANAPSAEVSFDIPSMTDGERAHQWFIPKDRGKIYARITGDYNPIHISKGLAKLFGFKRDIAHGFGVLAQALQQDSETQQLMTTGKPIDLDVIFKGPIFLEHDVHLHSGNTTDDNRRLDLYCGENPKPSICVSVG